MNRKEIFEQLNEVFRDVFDDDAITINDATNSDDIEDWDSLEHINLVVAIEKKFGFKFDIKEVGKMKNVGEMVDIIIARMQ
jgi:acyl carrier protein